MIRDRPIILPENYYFIYKITCLKNGKKYVGMTTDYNKRFEQHITGKGSQKLLYDIVQYSIKHFNFEILEILNCTKEQAEQIEKECILAHDCIANGYNISLGQLEPNDDDVKLDNIEITCKCVHHIPPECSIFSIPELSNPLCFQKLLNLKDRYEIVNLRLKKQFSYKYFQLELPIVSDIDEFHTFNLKLENNRLIISQN